MSKKMFLLLLIPIVLVSVSAGAMWEKHRIDNSLKTHIYHPSDANVSTGDWGNIAIYTNDKTVTVGTKNMLTAVLEFLPGKQLQPPHKHAEEEFTYIIEGGGTWSLNGIESPIQAGDLMYAKPGDLHGIANTGKTKLRFFVIKWKSNLKAGSDS